MIDLRGDGWECLTMGITLQTRLVIIFSRDRDKWAQCNAPDKRVLMDNSDR